jgi:hypothetical protein
MRSQGRILRPAALVAALLLIAVAPARADPLLSGYGGPGQGSQAILGATLIGGGPSEGGGAGSAGSQGTVSAPTAGSVPGGSSSRTSAPTRRSAGRGGKGATVTSRRRGVGGAEAASSTAGPAADYLSAARSPAGPLLGLTGTDALFVLLGGALLALTGALTWRLARGRRPLDS